MKKFLFLAFIFIIFNHFIYPGTLTIKNGCLPKNLGTVSIKVIVDGKVVTAPQSPSFEPCQSESNFKNVTRSNFLYICSTDGLTVEIHAMYSERGKTPLATYTKLENFSFSEDPTYKIAIQDKILKIIKQ